MKTTIYLTIIFFYNFCFSQQGINDTTFNFLDAGQGVNSFIHSMTSLPNGNCAIGGIFTSIHDKTYKRFAIVDGYGKLVPSFNSGTGFSSGQVVQSAYRNDDKIAVVGTFNSYNGTTISNLILLNLDGTVDSTFACWSGTNSQINTVVCQNDGKVIIGGNFTTTYGFTQGKITRLTQFGYIDNTFNSGTGFNNNVNTIKLQTDGKIIVGGAFTSYNGQPCGRIVRLNTDGTLDTTFNSLIGFNGSVGPIAICPNGKIVCGGSFTSYNDSLINKIAILHSNGELDYTFNPGTSYNNPISAIEAQLDNKIIVAVRYNTSYPSPIYQGVNVSSVTRLLENGQRDLTFLSPGMYDVYGIDLDPNDKILIGGYLDDFGYRHNRKYAGRLHSNGSIDFNFILDGGATFSTGLGSNPTVRTIEINPNGKHLIGGSFNNFDGKYSQRYLMLDTNGIFDLSYGTTNIYPDGSGAASGSVYDIALLSNGTQFLAGDFLMYNNSLSETYSKLIKLTQLGVPSVFTYNPNGTVFSLGVQSGDRVIVGGAFQIISGISKNRIARLTVAGGVDPTFNIGTGFNSTVNCLKTQNDDKIIVGGSFSLYNSDSVKYLIRLNEDGTKDTTFNIGTGPNAPITAMDISFEGKIIVVGNFTSINGVPRKRIAQFNNDGTLDLSFDPGLSADTTIFAVAYQNDGKILLGGMFLNFNGTPTNRFVKLNQDGSIDNSFFLGTGFNGIVRSIGVHNNGDILVGGDFTKFQNVNRSRLTRIKDKFNNSFTDIVSACSQYTWINGITYNSTSISDSVILTNLSGGDSIVYLNLTINSPSSSSVNIATCDSYQIGSNIYTTSGIYYPILPNSVGCDSIITLNLTVNNTIYTPVQNITNCGEYFWSQTNQIYSNSGTYYDTLVSSNGCDSIFKLELTILNIPIVSISIKPNGSIKCNQVLSTYQWYDCEGDSIITGATSQSFYPTYNSVYACIVSNTVGCVDTSNCLTYDIVGLEEDFINEFSLYPSVTYDFVKIDFNSSNSSRIIILDNQGSEILNKEIYSGDLIDVSNFSQGLFTLSLINGNQVGFKRFVKL